MAKDLATDTLERYNQILPLKQENIDASYCKKIKKEDGLIDFLDAKEIFNKYRAFYFWPGIFLKNGLKIKEMNLIDIDSENEIGKMLEYGDNGVIVGCKKGRVEIIRVQPVSKKVMDIFSYLRGRRLNIGDYLV